MALISAERLHRFKCAFCGSKEKNIVDKNMYITNEDGSSSFVTIGKIVTCSQCGYTMQFYHSALIAEKCMSNHYTRFTDENLLKESEEFVKNSYKINYDDPKRNPHMETHLNNLKNTGACNECPYPNVGDNKMSQ